MNPLNILFLDLDGCLNSELFFISRQQDIIHKKYPLSELDPNSIQLLNALIKETFSKVVISSTWRLGRTIQQLQDILNAVGFEGEIIGKTPVLNQKGDWVVRGNEIHAWLQENQELDRK